MTKFYFLHDEMGFYANEIYAKNKQDAIEIYKRDMGISKLPKGFQIWK